MTEGNELGSTKALTATLDIPNSDKTGKERNGMTGEDGGRENVTSLSRIVRKNRLKSAAEASGGIKDLDEIVSPPMSPPPSYPPPPIPYSAPDDSDVLGGRPQVPRSKSRSGGAVAVAAPPLVPAISMDEDDDEDEEQKLARRRRRQQQRQQLSRRHLREEDDTEGKHEDEEVRRQRNQMIACCSSSLSSKSCGPNNGHHEEGDKDGDEADDGDGRGSNGSPVRRDDRRANQDAADPGGGVPLLVLTKPQPQDEGGSSRRIARPSQDKREMLPPTHSPVRFARRGTASSHYSNSGIPPSPHTPATPTSNSVASSPGQSDRELLLKERLKMSRYEVEEWKRRYAEMQEKAMVAMKKTSEMQAQQSAAASSSSVLRLLPPASPRRMLALWQRQAPPATTPQQQKEQGDGDVGDDEVQETATPIIRRSSNSENGNPNDTDPVAAPMPDQTPDRTKNGLAASSPGHSSCSSSRPRNMSRHERSRTMGDGVFTMEDMTTTVQTLRQQNANLSEQCVALQEERDKCQTALDAIRATNVKLNDQRAELELDYINKLAQLAQRKRNVEEEMKAKLRGKINSIVFLRKHILSQDAKIANLEEQFIALNSRIRQVDEEKDDDDDDEAGSGDDGEELESENGEAPKSPSASGKTMDPAAARRTSGAQSPTTQTPKKSDDDSSANEEQGESAPATPSVHTKRRLARERERTLVRVTVLEQDNERLREKITSLTTQNNDLREEVQTLRDRVVKLSNLEVDTVPELVSKLSTTQSALVDAEEMCVALREERNLLEETLREDLSKVTSEKSSMEADFLNQIMEMEKQHEISLDDVKHQNVEKEERLVTLQRKVALLQEQVVRLEGMSELNDIECDDYDLSGGGGAGGAGGSFRTSTKRTGATTFAAFYGEEGSSATVQSLQKKLQEQEDVNMSLMQQLQELQQQASYSSDMNQKEMDMSALGRSISGAASDDGEQWC